jgi:8-oxo-dGTP pyrophosphatase MutT (NUDIX family)
MTDSVDLLCRLTLRLARPLPGRRAQAKFAPELSYGRHAGPPPHDARPAAVLALLFPDQGDWSIPLTLRPDNLPAHSGQVCFPGGLTEPDESSEQCALRELTEELGIAGAGVRILGRLSPLYVFASNFWVTPFVGALDARPLFNPNRNEVAEVVELPLRVLLDPAHHGAHDIYRRGVTFRAQHIVCGAHRIWGATSMMLGELAAICQDARVSWD